MIEPIGNELQISQHHISNSAAWLLIRIFAGLFLLETAYVVFLLLSLSPVGSEYHDLSIKLLWLLQTIKFALEIGLVLSLVSAWAGVNYYISQDQLIKYAGLSRRDESVYDLKILKLVELHQGWLGRFFNYGDIKLLFSSSGFNETIWLRGIYNPKKYERVFRNQLNPPDSLPA